MSKPRHCLNSFNCLYAKSTESQTSDSSDNPVYVFC